MERRIRARLIDVGLALALTAAIVLSIRLARQPGSVPPDALAYSLGVAIGALALVRRRMPLLVLLGSTIALQAYYFLDYPGIWAALPLSVALATAAASGHLRWAVSIGAWFAVVPVAFLTLMEYEPPLRVLADGAREAALLGAVLLLGDTVRSRSALDREHRLLLAERERTEQLLLNILPAPIASRLKRSPEPIADRFADATVLFADIVDFTRQSAHLPPERVVAFLDELFSLFDDLARERGLEKVKTIGDAYMVAGGVPEARPDHAEAVADMALAMREAVCGRRGPDGEPIRIRIGIDSGPVVAGVIGREKFSWDLWGDTVNTASRMESSGIPNRIQTTARVYERLRHLYAFEERGPVAVKGKGDLVTYFLLGKTDPDPGGMRARAGSPDLGDGHAGYDDTGNQTPALRRSPPTPKCAEQRPLFQEEPADRYRIASPDPAQIPHDVKKRRATTWRNPEPKQQVKLPFPAHAQVGDRARTTLSR